MIGFAEMKWMKRSMKQLLVGLMTLMMWSSPAFSAQVTFESPKPEVERITTQLLSTFEQNVSSYKSQGDVGVDLFIEEVDRQLSPVVAFNSIARGVMGKYSRRATPEQLAQFTSVFKTSLINFYGKALLKLDDTTLSIERVSDVPESVLKDYETGKARLIPVEMQVKTSSNTITLSYSMVRMDGRWKLRNIIVDGINIGIQFRNQFADAMSKHGNIQFVIDHWMQIMQGTPVDRNKA